MEGLVIANLYWELVRSVDLKHLRWIPISLQVLEVVLDLRLEPSPSLKVHWLLESLAVP